jgi:hypothetical protein
MPSDDDADDLINRSNASNDASPTHQFSSTPISEQCNRTDTLEATANSSTNKHSIHNQLTVVRFWQ